MTTAEAATLLGVRPDAPLHDIQHAYRLLARQVHPDLLPDATEPQRLAAARRFDSLVRARRTLVEGKPVIPIEVQVLRRTPRPPRATGVGSSLALLAVLAFFLLAIVSFQDAFRMGGVPDPPVQVQQPAAPAQH